MTSQEQELARRKIYQAMIEQGMTPDQQQIVSGRVVPYSPIQGLSKLAQAYLGRKGIEASEALKKELREHVAKEMGKLARPDEIWFVSDVPKTRSGKIMRRVIRAKAMGQEVGDITTLANPEAVDEIDKAV